ncbi:hypothetical protein ACRAWF_29340 [Streptomyces sp. L7]
MDPAGPPRRASPTPPPATTSKAIEQADLGTAFLNSLAITLPAVFLPLLIAAFAAYAAFTFMTFKGRDTSSSSSSSLLVVPNYVAFVLIIKLYASVHLNGTFPGRRLRTSASACRSPSTCCATTCRRCPGTSSSPPRSTARATSRPSTG